MAGVLNKIIEGDNVIKDKLVSIDNKLGTLVTYQTNQDKLAKEEQKLKKQQLQALKRQKADKSTTFEKVFGTKEKKDAKGNGGILGMLTGPLTSAIGGIGGIFLLKALGIAAIGGAIVAYIASEDFRNFVNNNILKPVGDFIATKLPEMLNGVKNHIFKQTGEAVRSNTNIDLRSETEGTSEKVALTIDQINKARNEFNLKLQADIVKKQKGEITEEELEASENTMDALEKIAQNQKHYFDLDAKIARETTQLEYLQSQKGTFGYDQGYVDRYAQQIEKDKQKLQATEKFLVDFITKQEGARQKLKESSGFDPITGEKVEPIQRQKGGFIVPGHTTGDSFPAMLPEGSLVLNRNAVPHFQKGGLVPTLLEPREQVLYPGNYGMREVMLNKAFPRFQTGGIVQLGKDMVGEGYKAWQHPDFNLSSGYTGSGNERVMQRSYDSRHNHDAALDFPGSHNTIAQLDALYAKLNTAEAKEKYGITQLLWRGVEGHGPDLAPNNYHVHVAVGGAQDFRGTGGGNNKQGAAKDDTQSGSTSGGGNIVNSIIGGLGTAGQAIGAVYEAFMQVFGDELGALFDFGGGPEETEPVNPESGPSNAGAGAVSINDPNGRAILNAIAWAEGTAQYPNNGYNTHFAGDQTNDLSRHPRIVKHSNRYSSDAFGRYQFMSYTWDGIMGGEMSPARQDEAALKLVARRGVDLSDGLSLNEVKKLANEWTSILGNDFGQGYTAPQSFLDQYEKLGGKVEGKQTGGLVGGVSNMRGNYSSELSARSEEQFIEKLATSVTPVINLIPAHQPARTGGGEAFNQTAPPTLSAYPNNNVALDLRNRVSINTAFS